MRPRDLFIGLRGSIGGLPGGPRGSIVRQTGSQWIKGLGLQGPKGSRGGVIGSTATAKTPVKGSEGVDGGARGLQGVKGGILGIPWGQRVGLMSLLMIHNLYISHPDFHCTRAGPP